MNTSIERVTEPAPELYLSLQRLIPQLGAHKSIPTWDEFCALVKSEASLLLVARDSDKNDEIIGILCLTIYRVPTGVRSIIEDVIVDEKMRGKGIGKALISKAIQIARDEGASGVSLTSNPRRAAANQLYRSLGFRLRETNPYYYEL